MKKQRFSERKKEKKNNPSYYNFSPPISLNRKFFILFFMEQKPCQETLFLQVRTKIHRSVCKKASLVTQTKHNTLPAFPVAY